MMPNDAKLGLIVGVATIILVAVVFFRKEAPASATPSPSATIVKPASPPYLPPAQVLPPRPEQAREHRPAPGAGELQGTPVKHTDPPVAVPVKLLPLGT